MENNSVSSVSVGPASATQGEVSLVPILTVVAVFAVFLLTPLRIIGYGYLPPDDALRHAAKVISGKPWDQILVVRPEITLDPHPGWHQVLLGVHRALGGDTETLVVFSVIFLFLVYTLTPLLFTRRPEAWLLSALVIVLASADKYGRLMLGRPYVLSMTVVLFLCLNWHRFRNPRNHPLAVALLTAGVAISTWSHCAWYLWPLPVVSFFLARQWKAGLTVGISCAAGILLGALFTGHPVEFLAQAVRIARLSVDASALGRQLVVEFSPSAGEWSLVLAVLLLLLWRKQRGAWKPVRIDNPVFLLAVSGWVLGLKVERFWFDWGIPALGVWMMWEFQDVLGKRVDFRSYRRLALGVAAGAAFYFAFTADLRGRWTDNLTVEYLDASNPELRPWLPGPGGIFYNDDMSLFFHTFFKNPHADWRYVLGYEQSLMPPEDLAVFRKIRWNYKADRAYEPWANKLRPIDRLVVSRPGNQKPNIPQLEWYYAATEIWIGRPPQSRP